MKNTIIPLLLILALQIDYSVYAQNEASNILMIQEQGSFAVGGTVLKHPGEFNPDKAAPEGQTFHGDHAYVFYQIPVESRKYPMVFAHGIFQFSKTWETTPDGREGFQNIFLRRGFPVYLVDQARRGDAGRSTVPFTITPAFDEQTWFNRFRVGIWPNYFEGVQFKQDEETLSQYFRQITPNTGPFDLNVYAAGYTALFDRIGPSIFVTHSQGGAVGWLTARNTDNIKAIVSYEPGGSLPFPEGESPIDMTTQSGNRECVEISLSEFKKYTKYPIIIYFGDFLPETSERPEQYEWTVRLHLTRKWAEKLNKLGADVTVIHLPEIGIKGNTHFPFSDLNNLEIADHLSDFLKSKGLDVRENSEVRTFPNPSK